MRIALVSPVTLDHGFSQAALAVALRAEELRRQDYDVHVLTTPSTENTPADYDTHHLGGSPGKYSSDFAAECLRWCQKNQPDIIHIDGPELGDYYWWSGFGERTFTTLYRCSMGEYIDQVAEWRLSGGRKPRHAFYRYRHELDLMGKVAGVLVNCPADASFLSAHYDVSAIHVQPPLEPFWFEKGVKFTSEGLLVTPDMPPWVEVAIRSIGRTVSCPIVSNDRRNVCSQHDLCRDVVFSRHQAFGAPLELLQAAARDCFVYSTQTGVHYGNSESLQESLKKGKPEVLGLYPVSPKRHAPLWLHACLSRMK